MFKEVRGVRKPIISYYNTLNNRYRFRFFVVIQTLPCSPHSKIITTSACRRIKQGYCIFIEIVINVLYISLIPVRQWSASDFANKPIIKEFNIKRNLYHSTSIHIIVLCIYIGRRPARVTKLHVEDKTALPLGIRNGLIITVSAPAHQFFIFLLFRKKSRAIATFRRKRRTNNLQQLIIIIVEIWP